MQRLSFRAYLKIAITTLTLFYGLVPALADLNETHLLNPIWSAHARFHTAWFLAFTAGVAATALSLVWAKDELIVPTILGLFFVTGFWVATLFGPSYGGALVDPNGHVHTVLGLEPNMFLFSVLSVLFFLVLCLALFDLRVRSKHER